jgi:predicted class III extradiol MEMO1 family dioxygenase
VTVFRDFFAIVPVMLMVAMRGGPRTLGDDIPQPHVFIGAAIVIASGVFIPWRETRRSRSR